MIWVVTGDNDHIYMYMYMYMYIHHTYIHSPLNFTQIYQHVFADYSLGTHDSILTLGATFPILSKNLC